jgi:hypothetical protein
MIGQTIAHYSITAKPAARRWPTSARFFGKAKNLEIVATFGF